MRTFVAIIAGFFWGIIVQASLPYTAFVFTLSTFAAILFTGLFFKEDHPPLTRWPFFMSWIVTLELLGVERFGLVALTVSVLTALRVLGDLLLSFTPPNARYAFILLLGLPLASTLLFSWPVTAVFWPTILLLALAFVLGGFMWENNRHTHHEVI